MALSDLGPGRVAGAPRWRRRRHRRRREDAGIRLARLVLGVCSLVVAATSASASPADDAYIQGYATAVLERNLGITGARLDVTDGVVTVSSEERVVLDRAKIIDALKGIRGVVRVQVLERAGPAMPSPPAPPASTEVPARATVDVTAEKGRPTGALPAGLLFEPLHADPRWPHFSAAYQRYVDDRDVRDVAAVSFGETFSFYRGDVPLGGQWEVGLQGGVFAIFDMDAESHDLLNADYLVGVPLSYRKGPLSGTVRVFHQSSHLGDEFLLRTRVQRVNLSYEGIDIKLSYEWFDRALRLYGGGGYLFDRDPSRLRPWSVQFGFELQSPWTLLGGALRPIFATDLQTREENGWNTDVSVRTGLQLESVHVLGRKLQLMLEYFNGHSPNGQFYRDKVDYFGLGAHMYY